MNKMMEKSDIIAFFDRLAPDWDAEMIRTDWVIDKILENASVSAGKEVLDVACGTGVLFPDYFRLGVSRLVGIDISPEMVKIARDKFLPADSPKKADMEPKASEESKAGMEPKAGEKKPSPLEILCGDVEEAAFGREFDCIVVYNAFPHFPDPERLIRCLSGMLKPGGTLTVAHGMSRDKINAHHGGSAKRVSNGLMPAEELAAIFGKYLTINCVLDDEYMYQVVGTAGR